MSDFNSSLPVRTENPGDVIVKLSDATTPSQQQAVNAAGSAQVAGQGVAGTPAGGVVSVQGVVGGTALPISGSITASVLSVSATGAAPPAYADYMGALAAASNPSLTAGDMYSLSLNLAGALRVDGSAVTQPISAASLPLPTGAATSALQTTGISSLATIVTNTNNLSLAQGSTTSGQLGNLILAAVTTASPSYTTGQSDALSLTTAGALRVDGSAVTQPISAVSLPLPTGAATNSELIVINSTLGSPFQAGGNIGNTSFGATQSGTWTVQQGAAPWSQNLTQILGVAPSATNALPAQLSTAGAYVSPTNPLPVTIDPASAGTPVMDYKDASSIAAGSSDNHDYTVTSGKTLHLQSIESSAAGKAKMLLAIETGVATNIFTSLAAQFNSTATPDMSLQIPTPRLIAAGVRVRVTMTNRDNQADDLYSSIIGFEV